MNIKPQTAPKYDKSLWTFPIVEEIGIIDEGQTVQVRIELAADDFHTVDFTALQLLDMWQRQRADEGEQSVESVSLAA